MDLKILYLLHRIIALGSKHRSLLSFLTVLAGFISIDIICTRLFAISTQTLAQIWLVYPNFLETLDIGFAPEVWLSLIALTLGTLVIAISVAAQTIPKIAELYMRDWVSLTYIWFLMIGGSHALLIKYYQDTASIRPASLILNLYIFLPASIIIAFPYIFYVLKSIQPITVIRKIVDTHIANIHKLRRSSVNRLLHNNAYREECQRRLLESLNQLGNLLEYLTFKEPKAQAIQNISLMIQTFITTKPNINPKFFQVGHTVCSDISFKTLIDQFEDVERSKTFYEQKCFRLLGNIYVHLLDDSEFDLASLCASEMSNIGLKAIELKDDQLLEVIIVRFNTMFRFALKHGVKHNEARNLYNLAFHYRAFIENLVTHHRLHHSWQSFYYLRLYGNEAYGYGRTSSAMYFIVDVVAAEMKKILVLVHQQQWSEEIQKQLLGEMLLVDRPPAIETDSLNHPHLNSGVRTLQICLALFYLKEQKYDFVDCIIADILDDIAVLGDKAFRKRIKKTCDRLRASQPKFWEDTDRGNANLYYTPDQDHIKPFLMLLDKRLAELGK
ncbi:hypothetical protein [Acaryochloris marina]|uniref:hypothetical protein n=1 Tax=Acaryochloris marina TaxID=155978 RepID=UPI001BAF9818|nr:hypothetical protein [Acaryochloris marina]QUY42961.1 hypothetical protein I1H34_01985 [Acaryochloris marina S15]